MLNTVCLVSIRTVAKGQDHCPLCPFRSLLIMSFTVKCETEW